METATSIHFVRHGHVYNPNSIYYGRLFGFPLSCDGQRQASATSEYLKNEKIAAIYCSPQLRTQGTAKIISEPHRNVVLSISDLLNEVHSPYDGCPIEEIEKRDWNVYDHGQPGYEQPADILARAQQFIGVVRLGHLGQQVIAVTHGDVIAYLMVWAIESLSKSGNRHFLYEKYLKPGSITTFSYSTQQQDERPKVEYVNPSAEKVTITPVG